MGEELLRLGREGDAGAMLGLLRGGGAAVIGYAGADGVTALHAAAANGHGEMVKLLLDSGASAEADTTSGETALHLAAQCGCAPAIQALLACGASGDRRNAQGSLPLHTAARAGQVSSVLALLAGGASPESTDSLGNTALHVAAGQGRVGIVAALLTGGATIDARGPGGATPLMRAAAGGHLAAVRALLRAGASPSIRDSGGSMALHHAAQGWVAERGEGYASIARELLVAGCDPGVSNFQEETPLTIASRAGAKALKKLLTEASGGVYVGEWVCGWVHVVGLASRRAATGAGMRHRLSSRNGNCRKLTLGGVSMSFFGNVWLPALAWVCAATSSTLCAWHVQQVCLG